MKLQNKILRCILFLVLGSLCACRGKGAGKALTLAALFDMKMKGYGYAIIPTGLYEFYEKIAGAVKIPDTDPGIFKTWVKPETNE